MRREAEGERSVIRRVNRYELKKGAGLLHSFGDTKSG